MRTVVLIHGAWHGSWCWSAVKACLDDAGVPSVAVDLPGPDLHADGDHVAGVLDEVAAGGGTAVLVGHSYGGAVVTDAGCHRAADRLAFVAAYAPDEGQTVLEAAAVGGDSELASAIRPPEGSVVSLDPAVAPGVLYGDCSRAEVERALALLRPQPMGCFAQPPRMVAWRERPVTYVVCGADRAVPPAFQRAVAAKMPDATVTELPEASHSPFLSQPARLAELLAGLARASPPTSIA